jgi:hypothetical protein
MRYEFQKLDSGNKSDIYYHNAVLGDLDVILAYLIENSENPKDIYVSGDRMSLVAPLKYLAQRQNSDIIQLDYKKNDLYDGETLFYLTNELKDDAANYFSAYRVEEYRIFGRIIVYKLKNQ